MMQLRVLTLLAPLTLAACGGAQEAPTARDDAQWDQAMTAGKSAFDLGRYSVAISQYRRAASLALLRDDGVAASEAGYDLAVAQLAAGQPQDALQTLQAARQAAAARGDTHTASFDLVQAAAFYRLHNTAQSIDAAERAVGDSDQALAGRAALIMGLAADDAGDSAALQRANTVLQGFKKPLTRSVQAGQAEIAARVALSSTPATALSLAKHAADLWRDDASYRDMSRALALSGTAASRMGDTAQAKSLWARAAQSAAMQASDEAQGDAATLAHGAISRGNPHTAQSDAALWSQQAGGVLLHPFEKPKTN